MSPVAAWGRPLLVYGLAACLLAGCGRGVDPQATSAGPPSTSPAAPAYVGMSECESCHAAETAAWRGSHHDLAMQPAGEDTVLGDFGNAEFVHGGVTSRFFRRGERYVVLTDGPGGEMAEYEVGWTFGAVPLQQYLVEFPDGRLQALPLAWDTRPAEAGGQRWFHVYGEEVIAWDDELHWTKPAQNWNYMCADCHSTGYRKHYDAGTDTFASTWTDVDVACEACHGPGAEHVARARADRLGEGTGLVVTLSTPGRTRTLEPGATTLSIVGGRAPAAEVEACGRCHARRAPVSAAYHHGRPVMDSYEPALVLEPLYFPDGQIRDEVFVYGSFRQSRMYAAGVGCNDCHEPHSLQLRAERDAVCAQCHLPAHYDARAHTRHEPGPEAPGCRDCHMPERTYMVVDPRRDHSFRVPRPDLAVALGVTDACDACHADRPDGWSADAVRDWLGRDARGLQQFAEAFAAAGDGRVEAGEALRRIADDPRQPAIVRASALALLEGYPGGATLRVAAAALQDGDAAVRLAALGPVAATVPLPDRLGPLRPLLEDPVRAVRIEAARSLAGVAPGILDGPTRERLQAGLAEYVDAQRASRARPQAHLTLGNLYGSAGELAPAARQYRAALALDEGFVPAWVNLADLLAARGDAAGAERLLADALARRPDSAVLHHSLGLQLVRSGRPDQALASLERAVELDPGNARFRYVYAIALKDRGETDAALSQLDLAHQARPADADVLWALATIHAGSGRADEAERHARALARLRPEDPGPAELLRRIGRE